MDTNVIAVKEFRSEIQTQIEKLKAPFDRENGKGGRERALAITKLQEAKMWLGMELQEIGAVDPYPIGNDKTTDKINAASDMGK